MSDVLVNPYSLHQIGGTLDTSASATTFYSNIGTGYGGGAAGSSVGPIYVQANGQILVGGGIQSTTTPITWNSAATKWPVRLNADGTKDTAFDTNVLNGVATAPSSAGTPPSILTPLSVSGFYEQPNGDIFVSTNHVTTGNWNWSTAGGRGIIRINSAGTPVGTTAHNVAGGGLWHFPTVNAVIFATTQALSTTSTFLGVNRFIARSNTDVLGSAASGITSIPSGANVNNGPGMPVGGVARQPISGGWILIGNVTQWYARGIQLPSVGSGLRTIGGIARLPSTGVINGTTSPDFDIADTSFALTNGNGFLTSGATPTMRAVACDSNDKIIVASNATTFNNVAVAPNLTRLNAAGGLDTAFNSNLGTGFNGNINSITVQNNNKIIVSGEFTSFNGTTVGRIARLNEDGTLDTSFTTNSGAGFNDTVAFHMVDPLSGNLLASGPFTSYNGITVRHIAKILV